MKSTEERVLGALDKAAGIAPELATELDWDQIEPTRLARGFRDVVFARIAAEPTGTGQPRGPSPWWRKVAAGLMVLVVAGGTVWYVVARGIEVSENQVPARGQLTYEDHLRILFDDTQPMEKRQFAQFRIFTWTRHGIRELQDLKGAGRVGRLASKALDSLRGSFAAVNLPVVRPPTPAAGTHARSLVTMRDSASSPRAREEAIEAILPALEAGLDSLKRARDLSGPFAGNAKIWLPRIDEALAK